MPEINGKVRNLVWNMPVNSKGGLERVEDLREACASAAHTRGAAARILRR